MINTLEELIERRRKYQEGVEANQGFDDGLRKLLSNMYPDEAHFIYELLQNAEDKGARQVYFQMYSDKLVFVHDAGIYDKTKLFNLNDIDSITNIGKSTKLDDPTNIGKFGVGFKSVFAYTSTPRIYSGNYSFEIDNLVIPKIIEKDNSLKDGFTKFELPFNVVGKDIKTIRKQVVDGLKNIKENTLLFLNNIEAIKYELYTGETGEYLKVNQDNNIVSLISNNEELFWLKFDKDIIIEDIEDNKKKKCTVNIAFKLSKDKDKFKIIPVKKNNVFIYFPAEKETSNLKFVINAPFASTIARDSVRNTLSNKLLVNGISSLAKDALKKIKELGLMDIEFLRVLPNDRNDIPNFYKPILETIKREYLKNEYFPTKDGNLVLLKNVYKSKTSIENLFNICDLRELIHNENAEWLKKPALLNQDEDYFLRQFDIQELSLENLIIQNGNSNDFENLYSKKTNDWYYKFFNELTDYKRNELTFLKSVKIIKLKDERIEAIIDCSNSKQIQNEIYIIDEKTKDIPNNLKIVDENLYIKKESKKAFVNKDILIVLDSLGVKTYNTEYQVDSRIEKYNSSAHIDDEILIEDIKVFLSFYKNNKDSSYKFRNRDFIKDNTSKFKKPSDLVLMKPYEDTFFSKAKFVLEDINYFSVNNIYQTYLSEEELKYFVELLKECGIKYKLTIDNGYVQDLEKFLAVKDVELCVEIWKFFTKEIKNFKIHQYDLTGDIISDSQVFELLKNEEWIPNKFGDFKKPSEIKIEELHQDCYIDYKNGFLREIDFGVQDKKNLENTKYFNEELKKKGLTLSDLDDFVSIKHLLDSADMSIEDLKRYVIIKAKNEGNKVTILPIEVQNPKERAKRNELEVMVDPGKNYVQTTRNHRQNRPLLGIYEYLRYQYSNGIEDTMFCQICHENMPFKTKDGKWYFEAVEIFDNKVVKKEDRSLYLSLCPVCAARYKEYVKTYSQKETDQQLLYIKQMLINGENDIPIKMDIEGYLTFNKLHLFDIQTKLAALDKETEKLTNESVSDNELDNMTTCPTTTDDGNNFNSEQFRESEYKDDDSVIINDSLGVEANNLGWD